MVNGKKGRQAAAAKLQKVLSGWCKDMLADTAVFVHQQEATHLRIDKKHLKHYVAEHLEDLPPRMANGAKPTTCIVRVMYEEKLGHAVRNSEVALYNEKQQRDAELFLKWRAVLKMQRWYRRHHAERMAAALVMQRRFRGFSARRKYLSSDYLAAKARAATDQAKAEMQATVRRHSREQKFFEQAARLERRRGSDLCVAELCVALLHEEAGEALLDDGVDTSDAEDAAERTERVLLTPERYVEAMPECEVDVAEDTDHGATRIQAAFRGMRYRRQAEQEARHTRLMTFVPPLEGYSDKEVHAVQMLQRCVRRFLDNTQTRLERLDDEAERPDPGIPSLPVHEKRKHAYSNALTRVVADRKGDMAMFDSAANSERCVLEHADIQIFSPEQLEPGAFIQPMVLPPLQPLRTNFRAVQTIGCMGPSLPGELRSSGVTKIEPIMEDEEQQPAETASIQTTHSVREAALSRMERCTAPLRMLGSTPTELESQLNKELEAIVWMRLGAPPLLHSSKGKLNADPFALPINYPREPNGRQLFMPTAPRAWQEEEVLANRTRRKGLMEERRKQTALFLEELLRQQQQELRRADGDDGSEYGSVSSRMTSRKGSRSGRSKSRKKKKRRSRSRSSAGSSVSRSASRAGSRASSRSRVSSRSKKSSKGGGLKGKGGGAGGKKKGTSDTPSLSSLAKPVVADRPGRVN